MFHIWNYYYASLAVIHKIVPAQQFVSLSTYFPICTSTEKKKKILSHLKTQHCHFPKQTHPILSNKKQYPAWFLSPFYGEKSQRSEHQSCVSGMAPVTKIPELCAQKPSENGLQVSGKMEKKVKTA